MKSNDFFKSCIRVRTRFVYGGIQITLIILTVCIQSFLVAKNNLESCKWVVNMFVCS